MWNNNWRNGWQAIRLWLCVNLTCQIPVEALYYKSNYEECCVHFGTTPRLCKSKEVYPICVTCGCTWEKGCSQKEGSSFKKSQKVKFTTNWSL